uniref:Uncharacterized protein n=1 Tax=Cajanus cajan TaxID=3821 RepID=A0A151SE00_CAJCA|nr:hypothetical protein KK1_025207 [Cajanus cajan]
MDASHILLGRPWQYDRKVIHDGVTNKIRIVHLGKKHTLTPLSPSQVLQETKEKETQVESLMKKECVQKSLSPCYAPKRLRLPRNDLPPKNVGDTRSFHGLTSFYRRFVKDFSNIASPLNELVKKDVPFIWGEKQEEVFHNLKDQLTNAPVLAL